MGDAKGLKPSPDWSKGVVVAKNVVGSQGFAVQPDGQRLYLVYPYDLGEGPRLHFQQLGPDAEAIVTRDIDIATERLRRSRLLLAGPGSLHLFWETRDPQAGWSLWYAPISDDGQLREEPVRLSQEGIEVGRYEAVPTSDGSAVVVWDSPRNEEVYGQAIGAAGDLEGSPVLLVERGTDPSIAVGADDSIDLTWVEGENIRYANFPGSTLATISGERIASVQIGTGDTLFGPVIGKSDGWIYVFWSRLSRSGLTAGQASTSYVSFPNGAAAEASLPEVVAVLPLEELPYQPYSGIYNLTQIVTEDAGPSRSDYAYEPNPFKYELPELAVGIATKQVDRLDELVQVATLHFEDGDIKGFNFSGKTPGFSSSPVVAADSTGDLYFSWRDGSSGEQIFLSTTAPEMKSEIDRIEGSDLANTMLQGGIEGLATVLLFPLAIPWIVPGYILIGVWKIFRDYESLAERSSQIILIVALILYEITKLLFLPTIVTYVPFSAWIDIPAGLATPLRVGYPIFTLGLGVLFAELNRRRGNESTLLYYTIVVFTDLLLTLAVYGVAYLGVF
ncbi:MAG: hypothetical protein R3335_01330 [Anaerolineales bacterium]|nr:hypothetical protein [Anaerolineales bacterium]